MAYKIDINKIINDLERNSIPEPHVSMEDEKLRSHKLANEDFEKSIKHRHTLVIWMMCVVSIWLVIAAGIVIIQLCIKQGLSDTVLCTLLSTTTINVLGLAVIVLKGLFNHKSDKTNI